MADSIDKVLEGRRQQNAQAATPKEDDGDKFFSLLGGDLVDDPFLELRFRDGFRLCLPYRDVVWFSYDPKGPDIKLDFGTTTVCIKGRGLGAELFDGLKARRVVWIKEADSEMQDHDQNKVFISDIGFEPEEKATAPAE
jgi:hypothetical protein